MKRLTPPESLALSHCPAVQRLLNAGRRRRATRWAVPVLHLWHAAQDRSRERANLARLEQTVASGTERAARGIDQYLTPEPAGTA